MHISTLIHLLSEISVKFTSLFTDSKHKSVLQLR